MYLLNALINLNFKLFAYRFLLCDVGLEFCLFQQLYYKVFESYL